MNEPAHCRGRRHRRAVVLAAGSGGDVAPMASIAQALAARGLETTLMAPQRYASLAPGGVGFASLGSDDVFESVFSASAVWHKTSGPKESWRYYGAAMRTAFDKLSTHWHQADTLLVSSSFAVAARMAEEALHFANVTVHLSPALMFSTERPPVWPAGRVPEDWPRFLKRLAVGNAERWLIDPVIRAQVDPFRRELGLPAVGKHFFSRWIHSNRRVVFAFPRWFAEPAADWPAQGRFAAFPAHPGPHADLAPQVRQFLDAAPGPLVVATAGTAVTHRPAWMDSLIRTLRPRGARFIVVGPAPRPSDDADVLEVAHAPFTQLLPRAALVAHHAGIGTLAEAMRAGIPQLLFPAAHDQPDNAERARLLGIASVMPDAPSEALIAQAWRWATGDLELVDRLSKARQHVLADRDGADLVADHALSLSA